MAFVEAEKVQIRRWLGYSAIYTNLDSRLESAIITVQSTADGGSRPDNTTELAIKDYLTKLSTVETRLNELAIQMHVGTVDEVELDGPRGQLGLRQLGRQYVGHISDALSTKPLRDPFSTPDTGPRDDSP